MILRRLMVAVLILAAGMMFARPSFAAPTPYHVLFISSYHPAFPSFFPQIKGVREGLARHGFDGENLILDIKFMDTKRFPAEVEVPYFRAELTRKLAKLPPYDLVIVADDTALRFAAAEQTKLFHDAPVVFLSVNNRDLALQQNANPRITGVVENVSSLDTLKLIARLYPHRKAIHVITDDTSVGSLAEKEIREEAHELGDIPIDMMSLAHDSYDELHAALARLPPSEPVLMRAAYRDRTGATRDFADVLAGIKAVYHGPIFTNQRHGLGMGVLGGEVVDHERQGEVAGDIAGRILGGEPVSEIPVVEHSPNTMMIDYAEARKLGLRAAAFPPDTVFINRAVSVLTKYRVYIFVALLVAALETVVIVLLIVNMRRRRQVETLLIAAKTEAELANKAKTAFLANMSHELRTPLNSIIGFSDVLMADNVGAIAPEKRREYLADVRDAGLHLLDLLNNILDVAKIEMGKLEIFDVDVDVAKVLRLCHHLMTERAAANNTRLVLEVPDDLPRLRGDATRLKQSVLNLLSNAVKFSEGGGTVTTRAAIEADGDMTIAVSDEGPGIPKDEVKWVLAPFNRGRSSRVAAREGSGIGLPLTARLAEMHGGSLDIESQLGIDTTVTLLFPGYRVMPAAHHARIA